MVHNIFIIAKRKGAEEAMANLADPFVGLVPRKMNKEELIQAIRADLVGELEAIFVYDAHVHATDDPLAKKVLADIRDEEQAHIGELMTLLRHLDPEEETFFAEGEGEVKEMMEQLKIATPESPSADNSKSTIGSLAD
jgi:rubrerythrin